MNKFFDELIKVQEQIVSYFALGKNFSAKAVSKLGQYVVPDKSIKDFERKIMSDGLKIASKEIFEKINKLIPSKKLATVFVLQELDYSKGGNLDSLDFVLSSGFETHEYLGACEKFEAQQSELKEVQAIYEDYLLKIRNKNLMEMAAREVVERVMHSWLLGKYDVSRPIVPKASVQELKESSREEETLKTEKISEIEDVLHQAYLENGENRESVAPKEVIEYSMEMVEDLLEEYAEVIPYMIEDVVVVDEVKEYLSEFQMAMVEASKQGNDLAHVFRCFFDEKNALSIEKIDNEGHDFLLEILNSFSEKNYSNSFKKYLTQNRETVYRLAEENNMFMQYLMGFWYAFDEPNEKGDEHCAKVQLHWYERAALNGYPPAIMAMGSFYDNNPHLPKDFLKAAKWYREAALREDVKGAYYLGCMYAIGEGIPRDKKVAQMWLSVAHNLANETRRKQIEEDAEQFKIKLLETPDMSLDKPLDNYAEELSH